MLPGLPSSAGSGACDTISALSSAPKQQHYGPAPSLLESPDQGGGHTVNTVMCRAVYDKVTFCCLSLFLFSETGSRVAQGGLQPLILLPLSPECCDYGLYRHRFSFNLCVYECVPVCLQVGSHVHTKAKRGCQASSSMASHLNPLRQRISWNLDLTFFGPDRFCGLPALAVLPSVPTPVTGTCGRAQLFFP